MINKKICILLVCFQSFFLTKVTFIEGAFDSIQGLLWKIKGLFKDISQFFNFKARANHDYGVQHVAAEILLAV